MKGAFVVVAAVLALGACSSEEKNTEVNTEAPAVAPAPEPAPVVVDTTAGAAPSPHDTMGGMTTPQ